MINDTQKLESLISFLEKDNLLPGDVLLISDVLVKTENCLGSQVLHWNIKTSLCFSCLY